MELFLRPEEYGRRAGNGPQPGVMVFAGGKRAFFPGGTAELAYALARAAVPADVMDAPNTRVEFGTADGGAWTPEKTLKHGPG